MPLTDERRAEAQAILSEMGFSYEEVIELTEPLKFMASSRARSDSARHQKWASMYTEDKFTAMQIGKLENVTNSAVRQALVKLGVWKPMRKKSDPSLHLRRNFDPHQTYGVPAEVVKEYDEFKHAYANHRSYVTAKLKVPWGFNLVEWSKIWASSGHWQERGNKMHNYCMTRVSKTGGFTPGNVEIVPIRDAQERGRV